MLKRLFFEVPLSYFEIVVQGHIDDQWRAYLAGLAVEHLETGNTRLHGELADQASIYGTISKLRDMNLKLISLQRIEKPTGHAL